jgi:peptide/nickel transport system permease protein
MLQYVFKRLFYLIPTLLAISIVTFIIIDLPPGDYLSAYIATLEADGESVDSERADQLRERYGLDEPVLVRYWKWFSNIIFFWDFGYSLEHKRDVVDVLGERMGLTVFISLATVFITWIIAIPLGIYTALKKYSLGDYIASFIGFIGMAVPNFLLALILLWVSFFYLGRTPGGLFSPEFIDAPWSFERVLDLLGNLWIPLLIIGTSGTAGLMRILRANLLDELNKPYVETARSKGIPEWNLTVKYPVRIALNPFVSGIGGVLPGLIGGEAIISKVLNLNTAGPLLIDALLAQDMYLAGSYIFIVTVLSVIGVLISDILLAWLDPRIRYS